MSSPSQHSPYPSTTMTPAVSDAELVRQAQAAPKLFSLLYERYRVRILSYCTVRLRDPSEAEDAASTIFIKALRALPRFTERGDAFRSWLFAIAHNELTDRQRQRRRSTLPLDHAVDIPDPGLSPEETAVANGEREHFQALLAELPARERSVLELRAAGCLTHEIARILQISEMSVRAAQSRGLRRLRHRLLPMDLCQEMHHV